jgi:hypothetical protein
MTPLQILAAISAGADAVKSLVALLQQLKAEGHDERQPIPAVHEATARGAVAQMQRVLNPGP